MEELRKKVDEIYEEVQEALENRVDSSVIDTFLSNLMDLLKEANEKEFASIGCSNYPISFEINELMLQCESYQLELGE